MRLVLLWLLALLAWGCAPEASFKPQPHAVDSFPVVVADWERWVKADPENRYCTPVGATGSMEPIINEHSRLLCVRYKGQPLKIGAVVIFDRGDNPRVVHSVADQNATHVYLSGYANGASDGWFPKTAIEGVVVGQLYLP